MALTPSTASSDTFYDSGAVKVVLTNSQTDYHVFDSIENTANEPLYLVMQVMPVMKSGSTTSNLHNAQHNNVECWYGTSTSYTLPGITTSTYVYLHQDAATSTSPEIATTSSTQNLNCHDIYYPFRYHTSRKHTAAFAVVAPGETVTCRFNQSSSANSTSDVVLRLYAVTQSEFYS